MRRMIQFLFGLVAGCLLMTQAMAVVVRDLNSATLPATGQSQTVVKKLLPKAFGEVLIKYSGNPGIMTLPEIQNVLPNVSKYLQSYSFFTKQNTQGENETFVKIIFDKKAVMNLLLQANQAIWSSNRPLTLMWVSVAGDQGNTIISSTNNNDMPQNIKRQADQYGIPVILPMMDLQDQAYTNNDPTQQFDLNKIQNVANRYRVKTVLAGNVSQNTAGWTSQWLLFFNGQSFQWNMDGVTEFGLISQALLKATTLLANQLSTLDVKSLQNKIAIAVSGINDLENYAALVKSIKRLPEVAGVEVQDMNNSKVLLNVTISSSIDRLVTDLQNNQYIRAISGGPMAAQSGTLLYQWAQGQKKLGQSV